MRNFVQNGDVLTFPAPAGGVSSGDGVLAGSLFGVAAYDAGEGEDVECSVVGVFALPKAAQAMPFGARLYWNSTNGNVTTTATGNTLIGAVTAPAASGDGTVRVRLNGVA
ncbi:DUF2190 family protein [Methylobacterium sp. A54F]